MLMYSIARDSLFNPKNIVKYHKKSGWFVFLYFIVLILFMSISGIIFFASYSNSLMTEETTGCRVSDQVFVCDGANYDVSKPYDIYGFDIYLLNSTDSVSDISSFSSYAIVLQNSGMSIYVNSVHYTTFNFLNSSNGNVDFALAISSLKTSMLIIGIVITLLQNAVILLFVIFIASITFLRLKKFITYKKIFKLIVFAVTPVAVLMTIYDLLQFSDILFILLLFIAYRSVFTLQKELYLQTIIKASQQQTESGTSSDIDQVEDIEIVDDEDSEEDSNDDDENQ